MSPIVKKKGERLQIPSKYWLLILTLVCVLAMVISFNTSFDGYIFRSTVGVIVTPFENGISVAGSYLSKRSEELQKIRDLLDENAALQAKVDELTIANTTLQQEKYELTDLRNLLMLASEYSDYQTTGARIISRDSGNWFSTFVINKGKEDGIEENMNVMAGSGLVGRVDKVGPHWARVMSVISDNSNVSSMVLSTSDNCIVSGNLESYSQGVIQFSQLVDRDEKVVIGDKIVTSYISDKYLPGILIGYVSAIGNDANNLTKSGTLTPAVDFAHLEEVLVIMQVKESPVEAYSQEKDLPVEEHS